MKKLFVLLLTVLILLSLGGCKFENTASEQRKPVKINMPEDNSVNGYRLPDSKSENDDGNTVSADNVTVESSSQATSNQAENTKIMYCANISSKTFHKNNCSSVKSIKEENKFFLSDRNRLIEDGYSPCKQCKP